MNGLLFLDFDGVMNTPDWCRTKAFGLMPGQQMTEFMPIAVRELNRILKCCDLGIVVSSSWRLERKMDLARILEGNGVDKAQQRYLGQTPDLSQQEGLLWVGATRGQEIAAWLKVNAPGVKVAILDDDADATAAGARHFQTNLNLGLTAEIADAVVEYFNQP